MARKGETTWDEVVVMLKKELLAPKKTGGKIHGDCFCHSCAIVGCSLGPDCCVMAMEWKKGRPLEEIPPEVSSGQYFVAASGRTPSSLAFI